MTKEVWVQFNNITENADIIITVLELMQAAEDANEETYRKGAEICEKRLKRMMQDITVIEKDYLREFMDERKGEKNKEKD